MPFSDEAVTVFRLKQLAVEVSTKIDAYNLHERIRADMIGITWNDVYVTED